MAKSGDTSQTLGRGLTVLELVASSTEGLTPAQIAAELGLSRTIIYRLVGTLVEHDMLRRSPEGLLTTGLGTLKLTANVLPALREGTRDILERLAEEVGATAHLVIAEGDEALAISVVEPRHTTFHVAYRTGSRTPLNVGALGRALSAARRGERQLYESEGELIPGAKGLVASLPGLAGLAGGVGVVTLAATDTSTWAPFVQAAADEMMRGFGPAATSN